VAAIDVKRSKEGYDVFTHSGTIKVSNNLAQYVDYVINLGVGEIIFTSIDNEGVMKGYEYEILNHIPFKIEVPAIINGGAGNLTDLQQAIKSGYDAVAASSIFVYFGEKKAVLISYINSIQ